MDTVIDWQQNQTPSKSRLTKMSGGKLKKTNKNQQINRGRNHPVNTLTATGSSVQGDRTKICQHQTALKNQEKCLLKCCQIQDWMVENIQNENDKASKILRNFNFNLRIQWLAVTRTNWA